MRSGRNHGRALDRSCQLGGGHAKLSPQNCDATITRPRRRMRVIVSLRANVADAFIPIQLSSISIRSAGAVQDGIVFVTNCRSRTFQYLGTLHTIEPLDPLERTTYDEWKDNGFRGRDVDGRFAGWFTNLCATGASPGAARPLRGPSPES